MAGQYKATHGQYFIYLTSKAIDYVRTFFIPLIFLQETLLVKSKNVQPLPPLVWLYLTVGCSYWVCGVFNQRQQSKSSHSLHTSSISNFQSHQIHEEHRPTIHHNSTCGSIYGGYTQKSDFLRPSSELLCNNIHLAPFSYCKCWIEKIWCRDHIIKMKGSLCSDLESSVLHLHWNSPFSCPPQSN